MAVDPVWAGVVGTAVGAIAGSATSLLAPLINWRTEARKLDKQHRQALDLVEKKRAADIAAIEAQRVADDRSAKLAQIGSWREGIESASVSFRRYEEHREAQPYIDGREWYETLKPHLVFEGSSFADFTKHSSVDFNDSLGHELSRQVTRIEREWGLT